MRARSCLLGAALVLSTAAAAFAQSGPPPPPVPRPFPGAGAPPAAGQPAEAPQAEAAPGGAPVYPTAEFLESYDAGRGQRYYLYGTNTSYETIVSYYKATLRTNGREIFRAPATLQFDLGRFDEATMAFPPSVVVKDYSWNNSLGYLFASGTTAKRYLTIIQIVPPPGTRFDPVIR
jgi:hypothetical protein